MRFVKYLKQGKQGEVKCLSVQMWVSKDAFVMLEPYGWKLASTVPRGARGLATVLWGGNAPRLPSSVKKRTNL